MHHRRPILPLAAFAIALVLGCGSEQKNSDPSVPGNEAGPVNEAESNAARGLPRLSPGTHISLVRGFNPPDPAVDPILDARWDDAVQAGMKSARIQIDWADLESSPGVFDGVELQARIAEFESQGLEILLGVYALDSEGPVMPEDLEQKVTSGLRLDSSEVLERHDAFLRWLTAEVRDSAVWGILITNEPGPWFDDDSRDAAEYVALYRGAAAAIHAIEPSMAVGATHTKATALVTPEKFHDESRCRRRH